MTDTVRQTSELISLLQPIPTSPPKSTNRQLMRDIVASFDVTRAAVVNVKDAPYYATGTRGVDDTAAINAALASGASYVLAVGIFDIAGRVVVPSGVGLVGAGGALDVANAKTQFRCTSAAAGVTVSTAGGRVADFTVDGNSIATNPMLNAGDISGRLFDQVFVINAAQDNWLIQRCQNHVYNKCETTNAGRDNLVLDGGCGGLTFIGFESNASTRYPLRLDNQVAGAGYLLPTHIHFVHSIFERAKTDVSNIKATCGDEIIFDSPVLSAANTGLNPQNTVPLVDLAGAGAWYFNQPYTGSPAGNPANPEVFRVGAGVTLYLDGGNVISSFPAVLDVIAGGSVQISRLPIIAATTLLKTAATDINSIRTTRSCRIENINVNAADWIETGRINGEVGSRFKRAADGSYFIASGADSTFDCGYQRLSDGSLQIQGAAVISNRAKSAGPFTVKTYTTAGRPSAITMGAGTMIYDTTLSKPVFSDGTNWRDAAGTVV